MHLSFEKEKNEIEQESNYKKKIFEEEETEEYFDTEGKANKERFLDPAIEIPKKSYSLEPDMANGWKPKKKKIIPYNVFSLNYEDPVVDLIVWELHRKKHPEKIIYLGPRKGNSYVLHENQRYKNPYSLNKKMEPMGPVRPHISVLSKLNVGILKFDSAFECGNLDAAIEVSETEYDLFMRVDTNSRGHTNWYYFSVKNCSSVGKFTFNLCNFRREKSLYQRVNIIKYRVESHM